MKIHHHTHIIKTSAKKACKICKLSSTGDRNKLLVLTQTAGDPSSSPKDGKISLLRHKKSNRLTYKKLENLLQACH